jgi:adenylate cyclase
MWKKLLLNPWMAVLTLVIMVSVRIWDPSFVESVRLRYFDQLITGEPKISAPISVVNIDEAALDHFGQWPFPRAIYADMLQELHRRNAGVIVFNVFTPESDRFNQDRAYATALRSIATVLPEMGSMKSKNSARTPNTMKVGQDAAGRVVEYPGILANVWQVETAAAGVGVANTFPEIDGVVRRMPLVILSNSELYPALALETLRVASGDSRIQVKIGDQGVEALRIPKLGKLQTDSLSRVWIDWSQTATQYSFMELPDDFQGGIVVVGLSAAGLINPIATARGEVWPQDLQAAVMGTVLAGTNITRPDSSDLYETVTLVVLGLLVIFFGVWRRR